LTTCEGAENISKTGENHKKHNFSKHKFRMTTDKQREKAAKRVEELRGFYVHCLTYCIVNAGLFCINYFITPQHWWFYWPLLGWGIGLLMNGLSVWQHGLWGDNWKERKIEKIMKKGL
jgi:hypothetical protein